MANDNSNQVDPRDARIAELEAQLADNAKQIDSLTKDLSASQAAADRLTKKLGAAKSAPTGNVVMLEGKSYVVLGTYRASPTWDEVKKGHVEEGRTLVAIDRYE